MVVMDSEQTVSEEENGVVMDSEQTVSEEENGGDGQ